MLQPKALIIDQKTYPIAAAFLGNGFLTIPEQETYGHVVVINKIVGDRTGYRPTFRQFGGSRRVIEGQRSITFENCWYDMETFKAEWETVPPESYSGHNNDPFFVDIKRRPQPQVTIDDEPDSVECSAECCRH